MLKIHEDIIPIHLPEGETLASLKWLRGANRYNNGATKYGNKYFFRLVMGWAQNMKLKSKIH